MKSRWYRLRVWRRWYLRWRDLLNLVEAVLAGILAVIARRTHPELGLFLGLLYLGVLVAIAIDTLRDRRSRDHVQGEVVRGLLALINKEIFKNDYRTRFTLFKPDSVYEGYISPWYRYFKGCANVTREAWKSQARYKRTTKEGLTAQAWEEAARAFSSGPFQSFKNRQEFEDYYINQMEMPKETVTLLSDYMVEVQSMFCIGFVASGVQDKTLGVLSLDFRAPLRIDDKGNPTFSPPNNDDHVLLDRERLNVLLRSVQNVLESFEEAERRKD